MDFTKELSPLQIDFFHRRNLRLIAAQRRREETAVTWFDYALIVVFMIGLYTNFTVQLSPKVPVPSILAGVAGIIMLVRRASVMPHRALAGLLIVLTCYLASIFTVADWPSFPRRLNGLTQISYSIVAAFGLFLTVTNAKRDTVAKLFLTFALVILVGCALESYAGLRPVSDAVRKTIYAAGVYDADARDVIIYGRVRPKFFASEPAHVTFGYTLAMFIWFVTSPQRWRIKLPIYVGCIGVGYVVMPGPTLMLGLVMIVPNLMFLVLRKNGKLDVTKMLAVAMITAAGAGVFMTLGQVLFAARVEKAQKGQDPSFFYRIQGPAIAGIDTLEHRPTGYGLTGEVYGEMPIMTLYMNSPLYSAKWVIKNPASELIVNYFWLHWVYFGAVGGLIIFAAITAWMFMLGVPSPTFAWLIWAILGQGMGAYVGPTCWAALLLPAAAAVLSQRESKT